MNWKLALLTGLVTPLIAVSCNSNPVNVPSGVDTPMLFSQDPNGGLQKVDLLWMIDDSGSMAEEQLSIIEGLDGLASALRLVDFNVAVVSTQPTRGPGASSKTCLLANGTLGVCKTGQFHSAAELGFALGFSKDMTRGTIGTSLKAMLACTDGTNKSVADKLDTLAESLKKTDADKPIVPGDCSKATLPPPPDDNLCMINRELAKLKARKIGPIVKRKDYVKADGSFDEKKLQEDLSCLTLVGTNGYGIEKGLAAVVEAVNPNDANARDFVRKDSSMVVVLVSDENDCSHEPVACNDGTNDKCDFNDGSCGTAVCNYYNHKAFNGDPSNPLKLPSVYATRFLNNLREIKNNQEFNAVSAVAITGSDLPQPGETESKQINDKPVKNTTYTGSGKPDVKRLTGKVDGQGKVKPVNDTSCSVIKSEQEACGVSSGSTTGGAVSGDRYYRFIRQFSTYYPQTGNELGPLCKGKYGFNDAFEALRNFVSVGSGDCITRPLLKCKPSQSEGATCGPEGSGGECRSYPDGGVPPGAQKGDLFCSASVDLVASGNLADINDLKSKGLCIGDVVENGENASCSIKIDRFEACKGKGGITYKVGNPAALASGVKLDLRFTGFDVESDGKSDK